MDVAKYLSGKQWLIEERSFDPTFLNIREAQFTLGNGYVGMRGIYEEVPEKSNVGTYIAGVYDSTMSQVTELVNVPNPIDFKIMSDGEKLDVTGMKVRRHYRALDIRRGLLVRKTLFIDRHNKRFDYQSIRFVSAADPHLGIIRIDLKSIDTDAILSAQTVVNTAVTNRGVLSEGDKVHFRLNKVDRAQDIIYHEVETFTSKIRIGLASHVRLRKSSRNRTCPERTFRFKLKKGETVRIIKYFSIFTSRDVKPSKVKASAMKELKGAVRRGFGSCLKRHQLAWDRLWHRADIKIGGDDEAQKSLRFNIYHLLISGNAFDEHVSIGARTLSGEGYRGHIFWDAEIYMFPFYLFTCPEIARNLLRYRYHQLERARVNAREQGYKGALFGWETADNGKDVTPAWFKALDWSITKVETAIEHHLMADIAYAVNQYYLASGDEECMTSWGAEILFETARFWASRATKRKGNRVFDIKDVIGPDEFHIHIDNNAYTNFMARWNLETAYWRYQYLKAQHPAAFKKLNRKINLQNKEIEVWLKIARGIPISTNKSGNIIEQFDGFFKKKRIPITRWDEHFMPLFHNSSSLSELNKTQLIKQADALLLFHLFPDAFSKKVMRSCFRYYDRRTAHKSSLSHAMHTIAALRAQYPVRAYQYFHYAVSADLGNKHGNSSEGIHGGSLGATWQAVVHGFSGVSIQGEKLCFKPQIPFHWDSLKFKIQWKGALLDIFINQKRIRIRFESTCKERIVHLGVFDNTYTLKLSESLEILRSKGEGQKYDLCKTIRET